MPHYGLARTFSAVAITLYSTTFCPYAWCARIVLHEKQVPFSVFEVDLKSKQPEFLLVSPTGKVPVLVDGDTTVWESMVINEYLEEEYGGPNLIGDTPAERARVRATILDINCTRSQPLARLAAMLFYERETRDDARIERELASWSRFLDELEDRFGEREWHSLDRFTLADVSLYTTVQVSRGFGIDIESKRRPQLQAWLDRMDWRDSVKRSAPTYIPGIGELIH